MDPVQYPVQSFELSWSWGTEPSQANVVYLSPNAVNLGSAVRLELGQYKFYGVCEADIPLLSSGGHRRQLTFRDYRKWMAWDKVYCLFNQIDDRSINGVRRRYYRHILPWDFATMRRTWTTVPYNASQIIQFILTGPGIETPWTVGYLNAAGVLQQGLYHPNMGMPAYNFDCLSAKSLDTAISEICGQLGLLYTLMPTADKLFNIVFAQKGVDGPDVVIPADSDDRESGVALSGNPTRVRVLGDRNAYQVHDIPLVPDWNTNWNSFYDINLLVEYIYQHLGSFGITTGADPEQIIGRQLAYSRALEITLAEFDDAVAGGGNFLDNRRYAGRSRNNMPAALYIQNLLFRSFRVPSNFYLVNTYGAAVYLNSLDCQSGLLADVWHDPVTGATFYDNTGSMNVDGNAYVIIQGYQVGKDMFDSIRPERFNLTEWTSAQNIWQKIECRIEDPEDDFGPCVVFDEPVIRSEDLVTLQDGYAVFQANPTLQIPNIKATLVFAGEKFSWLQTDVADPSAPPEDPVLGTQVNDDVLNVGGLSGEFVRHPAESTPFEIRYADGKYCRTKAIEFANNFLLGQWSHASGKFNKLVDPNFAYQLHGKINRVSLSHSPGGSRVSVELTNERGQINFVPERDLDRQRQFNTLFPGQKETRAQSWQALKVANAVRSSKDAYKLLSDAFHGNFTMEDEARPTVVAPCASITSVPVGSVFVKEPNTLSGGVIINTPSVSSELGTPDSKEFSGVSVRAGESIDPATGAVIKLQKTGFGLALVKGPVSFGDSLVTAPGLFDGAWLVRKGSADDVPGSVGVGLARQDVPAATTKLSRVELGAASGSSGWKWANTPKEIDPTRDYAADEVVHIQATHALVTTGIRDAAAPTGPVVKSHAGLWIALQSVPKQVVVSGHDVWNLPQAPYPVPGDIDNAANFWYWISDEATCY